MEWAGVMYVENVQSCLCLEELEGDPLNFERVRALHAFSGADDWYCTLHRLHPHRTRWSRGEPGKLHDGWAGLLLGRE